VITVVVPAWKCLNDVEALLVEGGMPPLGQRNGLMNAWYERKDDPEDDTMTYVYTPIEEVRK
jgi:hypothetical protein